MMTSRRATWFRRKRRFHKTIFVCWSHRKIAKTIKSWIIRKSFWIFSFLVNPTQFITSILYRFFQFFYVFNLLEQKVAVLFNKQKITKIFIFDFIVQSILTVREPREPERKTNRLPKTENTNHPTLHNLKTI